MLKSNLCFKFYLQRLQGVHITLLISLVHAATSTVISVNSTGVCVHKGVKSVHNSCLSCVHCMYVIEICMLTSVCVTSCQNVHNLVCMYHIICHLYVRFVH